VLEENRFRRLCNSERDGEVDIQKCRVPVKAEEAELGSRVGIHLRKYT